MAALAEVSAGYQLWRGRWGWAWVWVAVTLMCGDVASTYVVGLGLAALSFRPRPSPGDRWLRRHAIAMMVAGGGWLLLIHALGADHGSGLGPTYAYLAGLSPSTSLAVTGVIQAIVTHPAKVVAVLWSRRVDIWANVAPAGALGMLEPMFAPVAWVVIGAPALANYPGFLTPAGFQNLPAWSFVALGTVLLLARLTTSRARWAAAPLALMLAASTIVWAGIWYAGQPDLFSLPGIGAARVLASVRRKAGPNTEVIASQGVVGRFAGRPLAWVRASTASIPGR